MNLLIGFILGLLTLPLIKAIISRVDWEWMFRIATWILAIILFIPYFIIGALVLLCRWASRVEIKIIYRK